MKARFWANFLTWHFRHFASTERSPLERHLYSISLKDKNPASTKVCLTCPKDPEEHAYYTASFSPKAGYYVLNYEGPDVPKTVVKKVDNGTFEFVLEDNRNLRALLSGYELPRPRMVTVQSGGVGELSRFFDIGCHHTFAEIILLHFVRDECCRVVTARL